MRNKDRISILMPVYNTAEYLAECLESILRQTFQDWELWAVDDFSDDGSADILRTYAQQDSRISILANGEKGIIPALELAFKHSTGNFIHRMDSDDVMPVNKLETLIHLLDSTIDSIATGSVRYISSDKELRDGFKDYAKWINSHNENNSHYDDIYLECPIASPAWLMKRTTLLRIGGITSQHLPEDYDLIFRAYQYQIPIQSTSEIVHIWRDHPHRASRTLDVYSNQTFFDVKLHYFFQVDRNPYRKLVLWGAGKKGKLLYPKLKNYSDFLWVDNNKNRHGQVINEHTIYSPSEIKAENQVIVCVSAPKGRKEIIAYLQAMGMRNNIDFFIFA